MADLLPIRLQGIHGSPYTRKALAVLRYRRLPYRFIIGQPGMATDSGHVDGAALPMPKVVLLPTFYFPDASGALQATTDSTPIIRRLEGLSPDRSVIPPDPVAAFLNYVLEDYSDEWLSRCMFHYRWAHAPDVDKAGAVLPFFIQLGLPSEVARQFGETFAKRQVDRLHVVASNEVTREVIEASYARFVDLLDAHLQRYPFLFGARPSSADFAAFGQLTCLTHFDPTPMAITLARSPRVYAWTERAEDLCGWEVEETDWLPRDTLAAALRPFLDEVARTHMPQMLANARALEAGQTEFETSIDGRPWAQRAFPYQGKCLKWTREALSHLSPADQEAARAILDASGLRPLVDAPLA